MPYFNNQSDTPFSFKKAFNALPLSIIVIDRSFNLVFVNNFARQSYSSSHQVPIPKKCYQFSHHQDHPCSGEDNVCPHREVIKTKESLKVNHIHYDDSHNQRTVEITALPLFGSDNEVEFVIEITNDISRQVDIESALRSVFEGTSTEIGTDFFRSLSYNISKVLNVKYTLIGELVDKDKIRTHAVWTGDEYAEDFTYDLQYTPCENVIKTSLCSYPKDIQALFPKDEILVDMDADSYIGAPLVDSDGITNGIIAVLDTKPLRNEELSSQLLKVFAARAGAELGRKISERKQKVLETKLNHAQKMKSIGTLAGGIAHDFNNILSAIIGYSELSLQETSEGSLLNGNLRKILSAGDRAKDLVQQILVFSRQDDPEFLPTRLDKIIEEAAKFIRATLPSTIKIESIIQSKSFALADPSQIHQVVMNLCTNAAYSMQDRGGTIKIDLTENVGNLDSTSFPVELTEGNYFHLSVADSGKGIPTEHKNRIFDPYFTTKEKGKGTGLGLAIVHGIVQNHRGHIDVFSELGKGTRFDIFLPISKKQSLQNVVIANQDPTGTETIMVVDDEDYISDIYKNMLESKGYSVYHYSNSKIALKDFRNDPNKFDLILTDLTMPDWTGVQIAKEAHSIKADTRVILCTGDANFSGAVGLDKFCISKVLYKPIHQKTLLETVRSVLDSQPE